MIPTLLTYIILNTAQCYPICTAHVIFVNTPFGAYTTEQQTQYMQQIQDANMWWYDNLRDSHTLTIAQDTTIYAIQTNQSALWLQSYNDLTWQSRDLYIYVVYSPSWDADAWVSNNLMVLYVRDTRDLRSTIAHEFGHIMYHFPDMINDNGIMGYAPGYAYTHNVVGCQLRDRLQNPCARIYLPVVIK